MAYSMLSLHEYWRSDSSNNFGVLSVEAARLVNERFSGSGASLSSWKTGQGLILCGWVLGLPCSEINWCWVSLLSLWLSAQLSARLSAPIASDVIRRSALKWVMVWWQPWVFLLVVLQWNCPPATFRSTKYCKESQIARFLTMLPFEQVSCLQCYFGQLHRDQTSFWYGSHICHDISYAIVVDNANEGYAYIINICSNIHVVTLYPINLWGAWSLDLGCIEHI